MRKLLKLVWLNKQDQDFLNAKYISVWQSYYSDGTKHEKQSRLFKNLYSLVKDIFNQYVA